MVCEYRSEQPRDQQECISCSRLHRLIALIHIWSAPSSVRLDGHQDGVQRLAGRFRRRVGEGERDGVAPVVAPGEFNRVAPSRLDAAGQLNPSMNLRILSDVSN